MSNSKTKFTLEDVEAYCKQRKIILFDAEEYEGMSKPSRKMVSGRVVAWSYLRNALEKQRRE